jgi:hypothetical protein
VPRGEWQELGLRVEGDRFAISLDGEELFNATDRTFAGAGRVRLWTKAGSLTTSQASADHHGAQAWVAAAPRSAFHAQGKSRSSSCASVRPEIMRSSTSVSHTMLPQKRSLWRDEQTW